MAVVQDEIELIDPKSKTIQYKSGKVVPLSEQAAFNLFSSQGQKDIKQGVKESELQFHEGIGDLTGSKGVNTFVKNLSDNVFTRLATDYITDPMAAAYGALSTREGQEDQGFFDRLGENYIAQRMGRREARQIIDQENPRAAMAGKAGAIGMDLAMPLGRLGSSPTAVGALFGAGSSDRSVFEDPGQFAKETLTGGALGYGLGKAGQALERVSAERRAIREFPEVERQAQRAYQQRMQNFRSTVKDKIGAASKDIGKFGISKEAIQLDEFLARELGVSAMAGSREAAELENFLATLEANLPETLHANDLQRLYEAIESRIARGVEAEVPVLNSFKEYLVERLPIGAAENKVMGQIFPKVERETMKVVDAAFDSLPKNVIKELEIEFGKNAIGNLKQSLRQELADTFGSLSPQEFVEFLQQGNGDVLVSMLTNNPVYQNMSNLASYKMLQQYGGQPEHFRSLLKKSLPSSVYEAETRMQNLPNQLKQKFDNIVKKNSTDALIAVDETQRKVSSRLSNATGVQNPYTTRAPTNAPVGRYEAPQPPQAGRMATRFETTPLQAGKEGSGAFGLAALGKLFGVPKVGTALAVGKGAAVGLEGALRGLTSPSALGNIARQSIQGPGMKMIVENIASSFSSYDNGVIKDPQERKLAVSEIETDSNLGIEDKAMLQTYINRGKNLENLIRE